MKALVQLIKQRIYLHIIKPVIESVAPVNEAAVGAAVGMFVGMTPTVGIQMWIVLMTWLAAKYIFSIKFDLVIGSALVWLSNPLTMGPLYYGFLLTGYQFFSVMGIQKTVVTYDSFSEKFSQIVNAPDAGTLDVFLKAGEYLLVDLGFPMVLGSMFFAIPLAALSYILTRKLLYQYRQNLAKKMGISYQEWQEQYERK